MTHVIKTPAGNRLLVAVLTDDDEIDIGDIEDLEEALEEARAYAASLLDRIWSLGHELERERMARSSDEAIAEQWLRDNDLYAVTHLHEPLPGCAECAATEYKP